LKVYTYSDPVPTFPQPLSSVFWMGGTALSRTLSAPYNPNGGSWVPNTPRLAYVDAHRKLAIDARWRGDSLIVVDSESMTDMDTLKACAAAVKQELPAVLRMSYGPFVGDSRREDAIDLANGVMNQATVLLRDTILDYQSLYDNLDYVNASVYLLGPLYVDRDMAYISACDTLRRRFFRGKKLLLSVWGCYDWTYNPPNSVLPQDVMTRYVATIKRYTSTVCLFEAKAGRDDTFVSMLQAP
jgi:hypothetical protein